MSKHRVDLFHRKLGSLSSWEVAKLPKLLMGKEKKVRPWQVHLRAEGEDMKARAEDMERLEAACLAGRVTL